MMIRRLIICLSLILILSTISPAQELQENNSPSYYEQVTYRMYLEQQWNSLLITGNKAIREGNDYYYMRVRTGEAAFNSARYGQAARHLRKALEFSNTSWASELLFYTLLNSGRTGQAALLSSGFDSAQKARTSKRYLKPIAFAEGGILLSKSMSDLTPVPVDSIVYRDAFTEKSATYYSAGLMIHTGSRLSLNGGFSYMQYDKFRETQVAELDTLSGRFRVNQTGFYVSASYLISGKLTISPVIHIENYSVTEPVTTTDSLLQLYLGPPIAGSTVDYLAGAEARLDGDFSRFTLGAYNLKLSEKNTIQFSAGYTLLPFGNLDYYLTTCLSYKSGVKKQPLVAYGTAGFKILPGFWAELSGAAGNISGTAEYNGRLLFNQINDSHYRLSAMVLAEITDGLRATLRYQRISSEASAAFMGPSYKLFNREYKYVKQLISIGITCRIP